MQFRNNERGSASILVAALGLALLMATGLAVDGGRKLGALSEARNVADNAARAGAQMVDANEYRSTGVPALDPVAASQRANAFLSQHRHRDGDDHRRPNVHPRPDLRIGHRISNSDSRTMT